MPTELRCWVRPAQSSGRSYASRLAGRILVADARIAPLARFAVTESTIPLPRPPPLIGTGELVCRSTGWIDNATRVVEVWRHEEGFRLRLAGVGEFMVMPGGTAVLGLEAPVTGASLAEALLGPPLVLTLALQRVWCLHAGAVSINGGVLAFAGESGHGKSTLAAHLHDAAKGGSPRVADDALPVSFDPDGVVAFPHFPQLKLAGVEQYPVDAPMRLPLAGVYVIAAPKGQDPVSLHRLGERQAMQALIRHTIAARLFDRSLLAAHLDFCAEAAARIPVWRLAYPRRRDVLPQVRDAIRRSLSKTPAGNGRRESAGNAGVRRVAPQRS